MSGDEKQRTDIRATVSGPISGQVAVGAGITQTQSVISAASVTQEDVRVLKQLIDDLQARVENAAPTDKKSAAHERVAELEQAITAKVPDLTTMEYVSHWFAKHLPGLAGSITSVVIHPLVGKIVGAAGDTIATEFRRRFGGGQ